MRNFLTVLTLCVLTLTTSSVFGVKFDESRRTERLGLSFYDGRPLYFAYLYGRPTVMGAVEYRIETYRVYTGDVLEDLGRYDEASGGVYPPSQDGMAAWCFYARADDGQLTLICTGQYDNIVNKKPDHWVSQALLNFDPGVSSGDVAIDIFDAMLEPLSEMLRGWLGVVLAIGAVMFGWNFIRELWTLDFSGKSKGKNGKASGPLSYSKLSRRDRSFYEGAALGSIGIESSQFLVPKAIKKDVDFVTGAAFGLEFDEKTRESNRILMEMFNRLSTKEQKAVLKAFRESAFDKSFEDSAEKRFLAYQGEVFDDVDNPFTGRSKRRSFDPLTAEQFAQGYWGVGEDFGLETPAAPSFIDSDDEPFDPNDALDEAYYDDNGGTPF